jgi:Ni,Fe-hydrogenase III large subunit
MSWGWERARTLESFWRELDPLVEPDGDGVQRMPLGPVRADAGESIFYGLSVYGDEIHHVRLGTGYKPRHVARLMSRVETPVALSVAERVTGTSPVAHALAFSHAVEAAVRLSCPPGAARARASLAELERLMSHLGDLAYLAQATGTVTGAADLYRLKERVLRFNAAWGGHRYLRGLVAPGGTTRPLRLGDDALTAFCRDFEREFMAVRHALDYTPSFLDRLHGAGRIPDAVVGALKPVGFVGKSAGLTHDWRWALGDDAYAEPLFGLSPVTIRQPDAFGRYWVRTEEVLQSLAVLRRLNGRESVAESSPPTAIQGDGIGYGIAEGPRGGIVYRVAMKGNVVVDASLSTASQRNWPAVPPALESGNILQDFPIIDASFGLAVSALDL